MWAGKERQFVHLQLARTFSKITPNFHRESVHFTNFQLSISEHFGFNLHFLPILKSIGLQLGTGKFLPNLIKNIKKNY